MPTSLLTMLSYRNFRLTRRCSGCPTLRRFLRHSLRSFYGEKSATLRSPLNLALGVGMITLNEMELQLLGSVMDDYESIDSLSISDIPQEALHAALQRLATAGLVRVMAYDPQSQAYIPSRDVGLEAAWFFAGDIPAARELLASSKDS